MKCVDLFKTSNKKTAIQFFLLIAILPLTINLLYIIIGEAAGSSMCMIPHFIFVIFILQRSHFTKSFLKNTILISLIGISFISARYNNICYVKLDVAFTQTKGYFQQLITRIKSIRSYRDELPVTYINEFEKQDLSIPKFKVDTFVHIPPYSFTEAQLINNYAWRQFVRTWCGYDPTAVSNDVFINLPEVISMPNYPDDGSIKIINDTIIVKF